MELEAVDRVFAMVDCHYDSIGRLGIDDQIIRQLIDNQGVIASCFKGERHVLKKPCPIVENKALFPMHDLRTLANICAKADSNCLMSQANAQNGHLGTELSDDLGADACRFRSSGARRNENALGV